MTIVQDSCQSWKVVAACFIVYGTNFGLMMISGLIFTESLYYFNADRESTSFPFLLGSVLRGIAAPLGGYLSYKFGYQFVIMLGCILSSIGIGTCFFTQDIRIVAVHWCIYGLGCGLATCLLPQIINLNFTNHATKAIGIALSGPSVAGVIFPLFTVPLLNEYNVPGTYLILGAILSHGIVGALLLKNPDSSSSTNTKRNNFEILEKYPSTQEITKTIRMDAKKNSTGSSKYKCDESGSNNSKKQQMESLHEVPIRKVFLNKKHLKAENGRDSASTSEHLAFYEDLLDENSHESNTEEVIYFRKETKHSEIKVEIRHLEENASQHSKKDFDSAESKNNISNENNTASKISPDIAFKGDSDEQNKQWTTSENYHPNANIAVTQDKRKPNNCRQICSIFWNPVFIIIAVTYSFITTLFIVVPTILVDFANDKGIAVHLGPYLLIAFSISDLVGKVGFGWVIDGNYMSKCRYLALWFTILAFAFGLMVWSTGFILMTIAVVVIGMVAGTSYPILSRVTAQFIEKEKQAMAVASSNIFFIPMSFSMAPLIGYFRDQLGSYNGLLYIFCAVSILCTTLLLALPNIYSWKVKAKKAISQAMKTDI